MLDTRGSDDGIYTQSKGILFVFFFISNHIPTWFCMQSINSYQKQQWMILTETKSKQLIKSRYLSDTYAVERTGCSLIITCLFFFKNTIFNNVLVILR